MQGHSDPNRELLDASALCRQLVPDGTVEAFLVDHRQELFPDELFADLFPSGRGRPSVPADVIATVMVLQSLEGLSDRDAARALRDRISWTVACGLALDDPGFHHSVLTYWRTRLRASERPERLFDAVRAVVDATGVLTGKTRRALDSTLLDDAVGTLALVAGQDVEPGDTEGTWRIAAGVAPDRVISTVDPEARHMHKSRSEYRDGYKAHLVVEPETGLVTAAALTPATTGDGPTGMALLAGEDPGLEVLADSAYGSGEVRAALKEAKHRVVIKPIPLRPAVPGGFTIDDFTIDVDARTAT